MKSKKIFTFALLMMAVLSSQIFAAAVQLPMQQDYWYCESQQDQGSTAELKIVKDGDKDVVELDWDLGQGKWAQAVSYFGSDATAYTAIKFSVKGEGENNRISLKLSDADGSFFGRDLPVTTATPEWKEVRVPLVSMKYLWGGDKVLNKDTLDRIYVSIERAKGGKGKIFIRDVSFE